MRVCRYGHEMTFYGERERDRWRCYTCQEWKRQDRKQGLYSLSHVTLPVAPLAAFFTMHGLSPKNALDYNGERAFYRACGRGVITEAMADELACQMGIHPGDIWPQWYGETVDA